MESLWEIIKLFTSDIFEINKNGYDVVWVGDTTPLKIYPPDSGVTYTIEFVSVSQSLTSLDIVSALIEFIAKYVGSNPVTDNTPPDKDTPVPLVTEDSVLLPLKYASVLAVALV